MNNTEFEKILNEQDQLIARAGLTVRVGMEPTFTRRFMHSPEWLSEALGEEKLLYAYRLLFEIERRRPGGVVLHTLGRQYAGEELPRWSLGYYRTRNAESNLDGPRDPSLVYNSSDNADFKPVEESDVEKLWRELSGLFNRNDWRCNAFILNQGLRYRLLLRCDGTPPVVDIVNKPQLARASIHGDQIPLDGLADPLAANGDYLFCLDRLTADTAQFRGTSLVIELPAGGDVGIFMQWLGIIGQAARQFAIETVV
ncbi:MAG: transglutaminase family protein, partial [Methylococcales bacterium]